MTDYTPEFLARFWSKIDCTPGLFECWNWTDHLSNGYGQIRFRGTCYAAHRVSYELSYDIHPGRLLVCHTCDNKRCCNPQHLFLGTPLDNMLDMERKNRGNHPRGERHGNYKLTDAQVSEMRRLYAVGNITQMQLARLFDVSQQYVWSIVTFRRRT